LPTDYPDADVREKLATLNETQSEIIKALQTTNENVLATNEHLNSVIEDGRLQSDAQVTGRNVEEGLPVKTAGSRVEEVRLLDRQVRNDFTQVFESSISPEIKQAVIVFRVYGVTGSYESGEGYRTTLRKHSWGTTQAYDVAQSKYVTSGGNT